jgi:hypothetical protein
LFKAHAKFSGPLVALGSPRICSGEKRLQRPIIVHQKICPTFIILFLQFSDKYQDRCVATIRVNWLELKGFAMSSIDTVGQGVFNYFQSAKAAHNSAIAQPVAQSDPDSRNNSGRQETEHEVTSAFGTALLMTLQHYGIDPEQFERDFMSALRTATGAESPPAPADRSPVHLNAVG